MLINDLNSPKTEGGICSCAVAVNAGSFNDPAHRPGLAHFLEHMIFMGSSKYPAENAFTEHLSSNGGDSNAYTENELTNYHFTIKYEGL